MHQWGTSTDLFNETIIVLTEYKDPCLKPLLQGWLNRYYRDYLMVGYSVKALLNGLEASGERKRDNEQKNCYDWRANAEAARTYLIEQLNIVV